MAPGGNCGIMGNESNLSWPQQAATAELWNFIRCRKALQLRSSMISRFFGKRAHTTPAPTQAGVAYGTDCARQKLDFWAGAPKDGKPCPALIFFHGGGFVRGAKYYCRQMREVQELGGAAIAVNYRFVRKRGTTVALSMDDSRRMLDFVRERAGEWNIDPERIALHGKSSGGCIALWLGMKEPVRGVTTHNTPTTLEPEYLSEFGKRRIEAFLPIWGPMSDTWRPSDLKTQRIRQLIQEYSPLHQVHAGSPPLYLHYTADQPPHRIGWLHTLHCVRYGELMKERYDDLGLSCELTSPSRPPTRTPLEFLRERLGL